MLPKRKAIKKLLGTYKRSANDTVAIQSKTSSLDDFDAPEDNPRRVTVRGQVTSPELCDEALKLLAPSLERYKGCNIIDINPGRGLWSSKVHQLLNPRSHLLVEPNKRVYYPLLQPLLEKPGSKYRFLHQTLTDLNSATFEQTTKQLLSETSEPTRGKDGVLNEETLILATMTKTPKITTTSQGAKRTAGSIVGSPSEPFTYAYLQSIIKRDGFNSRGLVRVLLWVLDSDKFCVVSKSVSGRSLKGIRLEDVTQVTEVVGLTAPPYHKRRSRYEVASAIRVAQKMKEAGIVQPKNRSSELHLAAVESSEEVDSHEKTDGLDKVIVNGEALPESSPLVKKLAELDALERQYADGNFKKSMPKSGQSDKRWAVHSPEYARILALRAEIDALLPSSALTWSSDRMDAVQILEESLLGLEMASCDPSLPPADRPAVLAQMEELALKVRAAKARLPERDLNALANNFENAFALRQSPPFLAWDRRVREPLTADPGEFEPNVNLALLDIQPRDPAMDSVDFAVLYNHPLVRALRLSKAPSVVEALERLSHGAAAALLAEGKCPSVKDPRRGGRVCVENLRVRMLTPQMLAELCAAWDEWPFRATKDELRFALNEKDMLKTSQTW